MPAAANNHDETAPLVANILALLAKVTEHFSSEENDQWQWLVKHSHNQLIVEILRDSTVTMLRVINAIGRSEPVNGITISERCRISRGTVSKVTRRLLARNLISQESLPNNRKEILFRLTPLGRELFEVHRAFDEQMERGFKRFLERYSPEELQLLVRVLHDATEASFLNLGLQELPANKGTDSSHAT
ncbi:MarR family transcriptional regulator [Ktedonosporobacter rubrisoli]|uniref:MarR family transcriptional regulator n=1 Tax=Ktedonosporobacter rubrisoli TaxID=2509675 RepID=A0A4P6K020_KTERU|nr:MarR family transcriptional regulator [Ktedonosporobacter rubrisoli]QBD81112.1 MarR family transcriptional regulator [Ktedonosporobacter rubrisoli]